MGARPRRVRRPEWPRRARRGELRGVPGARAARRPGDADGELRVDLADHGRDHLGRHVRGHARDADTVPAIVLGQLAWIAVRLLLVSARSSSSWSRFGLVVLAARHPGDPGRRADRPGLRRPDRRLHRRRRRTTQAFTAFFRFGLTPMFLFSGTFFPIERLPAPLQPLAEVLPLHHGVEPTARDLCSGLRRRRSELASMSSSSLASRRRGRRRFVRTFRPDVGEVAMAVIEARVTPLGRPRPGRGPAPRAQRVVYRRTWIDDRLGLLRAGLLPARDRLRDRPVWSATSGCPTARSSRTPCSSHRGCSPRRR